MSSICAIVVTYHPGPGLKENIAALRREGVPVVIVDNGSSGPPRKEIEALSEAGVEVILNPSNHGIAAALNQGIEWALAGGFEWVATFDQDSRVSAGFFTALISTYAACPERERVAIVCPRIRDRVFGAIHSFVHGHERAPGAYAFAPMNITSGSLLRLDRPAAGGWFREDFFIDYVDAEYSLRCRRQGWLILEVQDAVLDHLIGAPTRHRLWWMRPIVTNHSPLRCYYGMRNRIMMYREYATFDWAWTLHDLKEAFRHVAKVALFEHDRSVKLMAMARGIWHGVIGRLESPKG